MPQRSGIVSALFGGIVALLGIVCGIIALFGVRKHGRKGILWPAVTGISLWLVLFAIAIPVFLQVKQLAALRKSTVQTAAIHEPTAIRIEDSTLGFSFDLPDGYETFPTSAKPPECSHAFVKPSVDGRNGVLLVKPLGGILGREHLKLSEIPAGKNLTLASFTWRGLVVDGIRVPEKTEAGDYLSFNIQIPLRKQAIQLGFGGPADSENEIRALAEHVLASLEGATNW